MMVAVPKNKKKNNKQNNSNVTAQLKDFQLIKWNVTGL